MRLTFGIPSHFFALAIQHIFHRSPKAHFIPEIARASAVIGPVAATPILRECTTECASGIGLVIGKHALGSGFAPDHGMDVSRPDMESMGSPFAVVADRSKRLQHDAPRFGIQGPRGLFQMLAPRSLPRWIGGQDRAAVHAVLCIHPTLFRTRQMSAVGGECQQVGQWSHIEQVWKAVWNSRLPRSRSLTLPAPFRLFNQLENVETPAAASQAALFH